jgi:hypothetical protein
VKYWADPLFDCRVSLRAILIVCESWTGAAREAPDADTVWLAASFAANMKSDRMLAAISFIFISPPQDIGVIVFSA